MSRRGTSSGGFSSWLNGWQDVRLRLPRGDAAPILQVMPEDCP
ncbi:hypothetical protein [Roseomonas sp. WA12]